MANDISLTIRLPHELNTQLQEVAKALGVTRTNLLRAAIHDFLATDSTSLDFSVVTGPKDRLVLNVNQLTYNLLERACEKYSQSMNAVVTAVGALVLERSIIWLQSTNPSR